MTIMVKDTIDMLDKLAKEHRVKKNCILIDPFALAALREELGLDFEEDLTEYHGYTIKVNENEGDFIQLI